MQPMQQKQRNVASLCRNARGLAKCGVFFAFVFLFCFLGDF